MWHRVVVLLAACTIMPAQTQTAGSISGTVRDASTGAPLSNVRISLPGSEAATTDSEGRFRLEEIEPGPKRVWASDSVRGAGAGVSVMVRAGEEATVEIRLKPGGSISGRVVDSGGQPVARVVVLLPWC
jgi:protocatechuate 3,4-dioxygenase beta subunit